MRERVTERDREHGKKEQQLREREGEAFSHMTILIQYSTLMKYFHKICLIILFLLLRHKGDQ